MLICKLCGVPYYERDPQAIQPVCRACRQRLAYGVMLVSVADERVPPVRTGSWLVVREAKLTQLFADPALIAHALELGYLYVPDATWTRLGLPRTE